MLQVKGIQNQSPKQELELEVPEEVIGKEQASDGQVWVHCTKTAKLEKKSASYMEHSFPSPRETKFIPSGGTCPW